MDQIIKFIPEEHRVVLGELKKFGEEMLAGSLNMKELNGKKYLPGFFPETAEYAREQWDGIRENDVFVASYPKTGTNWLSDVVWRILSTDNQQLYDIVQNLPLPLITLEVGPASKYKIVDCLPLPRRVFFTHVDGEDFPIKKVTEKGAKVIYILRNPKDQAVSWYHFTQKIPALKKEPELYPDDWKTFSELYFSGKHGIGLKEGDWYPEHILSWYKHKHQDNVKFVYFEDMKKDLKLEVKKISEYLGVQLTDKRVNEIAEACGFDAMKKEAEMKQGNVYQKRKTLNMMRKGQVGGWKDYFTVSQSEAIDEEFKQKLANTDIRFTYELA